MGDLLRQHPFLVALAVAGAGMWLYSVRRNPYTKCRRCSGVGKFFGWLATRSWHNCPRCNDSGKQLRVGAVERPPRRR